MDMEPAITSAETEAKAFKYQIYHELSSGKKSRRYLAENTIDNKIYQLELFVKDDEQVLPDLSIISHIKHDSIIQIKESVRISEVRFLNSEVEKACKVMKLEEGLVIDCVTRCTLLNLLQQLGTLPEVVARSYTKQLLDALECLHDQQIAHCDLKLDSLFLDTHYCLKLGGLEASKDFSKKVMCSERIGTKRHLAPETLLNTEYDPFAADIFALGVAVFGLINGYLPFDSASLEDELYVLIVDEKWEKFWSLHEEIFPSNTRLGRANLREFFERLLCPNPERRATIAEIGNLDWMKIPMIDREQVGSWIIEIAKKQKKDFLLSSL